MTLLDHLREDLVFLDIHPRDMHDCLKSIVDQAASRGAINDPEDALGRLLERERTMSTGMGGGVAVPHAKTEKCRNMVVAMGRVDEGVDFRSIDAKPVYLVFLLLGPPDSTRQHVDLLARIAYLVKTPGVVDAIRAAKSPAEVLTVMRGEDHARR